MSAPATDTHIEQPVPPVFPVPVRVGTPDELARLRALLRDAGFTEPVICRRLRIPRIYEFRTIEEGREGEHGIRDRLDLLVRLFLDVVPVPRDTVLSMLGAEQLDLLRRLGLVRTDDAPDAPVVATVLLYPTEGLWLASDIGQSTKEENRQPVPDLVYPAITGNTGLFLSALPDTPCERLLELCAGTGIAALAGARYATHAWAADITERATRFAEFNIALNALANVTAVCGDLYVPFAGETFDRIVCHPPYVASSVRKMIYRDGGPDGEEITRRVIEGLPAHLAPGGTFHCTCVATDRTEGPLEERLRRMLGGDADQFDIFVATMESHDPSEYYCRVASAGRMSFADAERAQADFKAMGIEALVYAAFEIHRHAERQEPLTIRRARGANMGGRTMGQMLRWEHRMRAPESWRDVLDARPKATGRGELRVTQRLVGGEWVPSSITLATEGPFVASMACTPETAAFLARCDGTRTVREHLALLVELGHAPADASDEGIAKLVQSLVSTGILVLDGMAD